MNHTAAHGIDPVCASLVLRFGVRPLFTLRTRAAEAADRGDLHAIVAQAELQHVGLVDILIGLRHVLTMVLMEFVDEAIRMIAVYFTTLREEHHRAEVARERELVSLARHRRAIGRLAPLFALAASSPRAQA